MEARRSARFFVFMSRTLRPYLPGAAFHIFARTQGHVPWLEDLCEPVERIVLEGIQSSDAMRISHAIMPNHFHIVLRQGVRPLGWVMQPIMRRTALLVQRRLDLKGHVFEREFGAKHCDTGDYVRTAIVYNHLNGWRAGLCPTPTGYRWCSHARYVTSDPLGTVDLELVRVLKLFAEADDDPPEKLRANYIAHLEWAAEKDRCAREGIPFDRPQPTAYAGDRVFQQQYSVLQIQPARPRKDLRDKAIEVLCDVAPQLTIDEIRRRHLPRRLREPRNQVIAVLVQARYAGKAIADYFRISNSVVSAIASAIRYADLQKI